MMRSVELLLAFNALIAMGAFVSQDFGGPAIPEKWSEVLAKAALSDRTETHDDPRGIGMVRKAKKD